LSGVAYADAGLDAALKGDYKTAIKEWQPLAEQGDSIAQYNLSLMYRYGRGVLKDEKKEIELLGKSAEQGYIPAQYELGKWYASWHGWIGTKLPKYSDTSRGRYWIKKVYENGDDKYRSLAEEVWNEHNLGDNSDIEYDTNTRKFKPSMLNKIKSWFN
jgi:TPR repeat protein